MLPSIFSWLNIELMQMALKLSENDESIRVTNLKLMFATEPGDNFLSTMLRASVEYSKNNSGRMETKKKSFIIKTAPATNEDVVEALGVFNREIKMMDTTLVNMNELLSVEGCRLSPRVFYTDNGEPPFIVMDDLAELGYLMSDRMIGLDLEHCIVAIRLLAKFHASSIALCEKDPNALASYTKSVFHKDNPKQIKEMFGDGIAFFAKEVLNWSELGVSAHSISDKFFKLSDVCYEKAIQCSQRKATNFNVLNHGDFWVNNMLFRYNEEGKVIDSILVDFQLSCWTSPAVDLMNFTSTSLTEQVDLHHRDVLLEEYLNILTKTMTNFRCSTKAPNMEDLKQILREHELLEVLYTCVYFPIQSMPKTATKTLDELLEPGNQCDNPVYRTPGFRRRLLKRLLIWNTSGVLDV